MVKIIEAHGLVPIAVDMDDKSLGPNVLDVERAIGKVLFVILLVLIIYTPKNTKAILSAHIFGALIPLNEMAALALKHKLLLIEVP